MQAVGTLFENGTGGRRWGWGWNTIPVYLVMSCDPCSRLCNLAADDVNVAAVIDVDHMAVVMITVVVMWT